MSKKMQTQEEHHEELVKGLCEQMKTVLEGSEQPIFIYLDDNHKACNSRFATLLGFSSPEEWASIDGFLEPYVAEKSRDTLMKAYWDAMKKMVVSTSQITFVKKGGGTVNSTVVLVPMPFQGHLFSVHFVTNAVS
jgi:PAS domain-containing protein